MSCAGHPRARSEAGRLLRRSRGPRAHRGPSKSLPRQTWSIPCDLRHVLDVVDQRRERHFRQLFAPVQRRPSPRCACPSCAAANPGWPAGTRRPGRWGRNRRRPRRRCRPRPAACRRSRCAGDSRAPGTPSARAAPASSPAGSRPRRARRCRARGRRRSPAVPSPPARARRTSSAPSSRPRPSTRRSGSKLDQERVRYRTPRSANVFRCASCSSSEPGSNRWPPSTPSSIEMTPLSALSRTSSALRAIARAPPLSRATCCKRSISCRAVGKNRVRSTDFGMHEDREELGVDAAFLEPRQVDLSAFVPREQIVLLVEHGLGDVGVSVHHQRVEVQLPVLGVTSMPLEWRKRRRGERRRRFACAAV